MRCHTYRTDVPALLAALTDADALARWQTAVVDELPGLADRAMVRHLKRLSGAASQAQAEGFERLAEADPALADALLSDLLAVATFHNWPLPLTALGDQDLDLDDHPRGLLGEDTSPDSARVWLLDRETIALARAREAGEPEPPTPGGACGHDH
jgi:hypothetical protein